jgi:hypothetical protein
MAIDRFASEVTLEVEVEILEAARAVRGRLSDRPEHSVPPEPVQVALAVWLSSEADHRIDLVPWLPADVLEALTAEALERLED